MISCAAPTPRIIRHQPGEGGSDFAGAPIHAAAISSAAPSRIGAAASRRSTFAARIRRSSPIPESSAMNAEACTANFDIPRNRLNPGTQS